jgi:FAD-dependent urate hydroxylase
VKIVVSGAGVSGLAAAVALAARGHDVEVYECARELRAGGNGVLMWHNATGILRDLGIGLDGFGRRLDTADVWSSAGQPLMRTSLAEITDRVGSPCIGAMRGEIVQRLSSALPTDAIRFGHEVTGFRVGRGGRGVTVEFADGSSTDADVLIGADGYRSAVRTRLFGEDHARYTGLASWHGTTDVPLDLGDEHTVPTYYGRRGLCTLHPVAGQRVHWSFEVPFDNGHRYAPPPGARARADVVRRGQRLPLLQKWFSGWTNPVSHLLSTIKEEDIAIAPHTIHTVRREWGRGPVTLVGDAAHAIPPRAGWGVNQALEDSWVIGHALAEPGDAVERLRAYERVRRVRAVKVRSRARMMRHSNLFLLMLRMTRDGLQSTRMLEANIRSSSSFLNDERPAAGAAGPPMQSQAA